MALPLRAAAQEPGQAPASTHAVTASTPEAGAHSEKAEKSEQAELDVYRHSPKVKTIARMVHLPLETTARIFELVNFAIIALAILIPLVKYVPRMLHNRKRALSQNIASARKMTEDANSRLSAVEAQMAKLDEEIAAIRSRVEEESRQDEARIKASIAEESGRIVSAAEQEIAAAAAHARRGLRDFAADLAIEQAARQLVLTPEADSALIAEFVRETAKGGQN
ncbi:MAG: ATP synthase F0 subunit B [Acidobacteriota bacterium]|nr:ATP synthase F0 subunit B [Acidobacteriota bacterium]